MVLENRDPQHPKKHGGGPSRSPLQRAIDRRKAVQMTLRGKTQTEIAAELTVTPQQVSLDLKKAQEEWRDHTTMDLGAAKALELGKINHVEEMYWERYEEDPSNSILDGILKCIDRRCKLLGLDAPIRVDQRNINFTIEFDTPASRYALNGNATHSLNGGSDTDNGR